MVPSWLQSLISLLEFLFRNKHKSLLNFSGLLIFLPLLIWIKSHAFEIPLLFQNLKYTSKSLHQFAFSSGPQVVIESPPWLILDVLLDKGYIFESIFHCLGGQVFIIFVCEELWFALSVKSQVEIRFVTSYSFPIQKLLLLFLSFQFLLSILNYPQNFLLLWKLVKSRPKDFRIKLNFTDVFFKFTAYFFVIWSSVFLASIHKFPEIMFVPGSESCF